MDRPQDRADALTTGGAANPAFGQAAHAYHYAAQIDRRFAPHADLALERKGKLGQGGMGAVHLVLDHRNKREAALKVLLQSDHAAVERFLREADLTARLEHPAIPAVYEAGISAGGQHYILMPVVRGQELKALIRVAHETGLADAERRELLTHLVRVGEAVAYAHSKGVIHRDLKPANVMIGAFGEVLVMDWGLARDLAQSEQQDAAFRSSLPQAITQEGSILGTPGYMPPEQAGGDPLDERADVFALGAMLCEILTNKPPIEGETVINKVAATLRGDIKLPRDRRADAPPELHALAAKALAVDPDDRLESADAFVTDLKAYLADRELVVHRYGLLERGRRWARNHPTLLVAVALGSLLVAAALTVVRQRGQVTRAQESERVAVDAASQVQRVLDLLREARSLARRGQRKQVQTRLEQALTLSGATAPMLLSCAQILEDAGLEQEALAWTRRAEKAAPDSYDVLFQLHHLQTLDDPEGFARTDAFQRLVDLTQKRKEENEFTLFIQGREAYTREEFERSLELFSRIAQHSTDFVWLHIGRGMALHELGKLTAAVEAYSRALELRPRAADVYFYRAQSRGELRHLKSALRDIERAIELRPKLSAFYRLRAWLHIQRRDVRAAEEDIAQAIKLAPSSPHPLAMRAEIKVRTGRFRAAIVDANEALTADPKLARALHARAAARARLKEYRLALADVTSFLKLRPKSIEGYELRAFVHARLDDPRSALNDLSEAIRLKPRDAALYVSRAQAYQQLDQLDRARSDLKRALELDPKLPDADQIRKSIEAWR